MPARPGDWLQPQGPSDWLQPGWATGSNQAGRLAPARPGDCLPIGRATGSALGGGTQKAGHHPRCVWARLRACGYSARAAVRCCAPPSRPPRPAHWRCPGSRRDRQMFDDGMKSTTDPALPKVMPAPPQRRPTPGNTERETSKQKRQTSKRNPPNSLVCVSSRKITPELSPVFTLLPSL